MAAMVAILDFRLERFSYFCSTSHPDTSYQVSSQLAQGCRRSTLLKQLLTPHDERRTMTDHNKLIKGKHISNYWRLLFNNLACILQSALFFFYFLNNYNFMYTVLNNPIYS